MVWPDEKMLKILRKHSILIYNTIFFIIHKYCLDSQNYSISNMVKTLKTIHCVKKYLGKSKKVRKKI